MQSETIRDTLTLHSFGVKLSKELQLHSRPKQNRLFGTPQACQSILSDQLSRVKLSSSQYFG